MNRTLTVAVLLTLLAAPTMAEAQTRVTGGQFRQHTLVDDTLNRRGRIELGFSLAGAVSFSSVTPEDGDPVSQTNAYLAPSLIGGYMVTDNIEVRLSLGTQWIRSSVNEELSQDAISGVVAVQGLYQHDFILGLAGYAGVGLGGYYGTRSVPIGTDGLNASYANYGGLGQLLVGLVAMPGPRLLLRGGLRLDFLIGAETPQSEVIENTSSTAFNVHALAELAIGWRFN